MQKLTRNTFTKGRNTDQDRNKISPDQYFEAHNVSLVGDGVFYSLQNLKGTVNVQDILGTNLALVNECLGVFRTYWQIGGAIHQCLTIFTLSTTNLFKVWCYDIDGDAIYEVYEETVANDYIADDRVIDAKSYQENGIDNIYFTDNYHELRHIKCVIPTPYTPNFLTVFQISLQRRGGIGNVTYSAMTTGSLLSGTYQFAYRGADPTGKSFTKWSSLTDPIHVYSSADTSNIVYAGIGLPTPFGIVININPTSDEIATYPFFQLAVVENVGPVPITTIAALLPLEPMANRLSYNYKANIRIGEIPIDDIVVDLAQIKTAKTLNIKQNRLFIGNIQYTNLAFDNGHPTITSGSIISQAVNYSNQEDATRFIGHFRNEVYRYGAVYSDKYGNRSPVEWLDMTNVVGNTISGAKDMKFPDRDVNSIFDTSGNIKALGLSFIGLKNHPTYATKVEIVRVKRIKNIQFQSPIVPMASIKGIGALDNYPNKADGKDYPNALPQTASAVLAPKNLFWPENRDIDANPKDQTSPSFKRAGEAEYSVKFGMGTVMIFPQSTLYGASTPFNFTGAEKLSVIDYALLKAKITDNSISTVETGDDVQTDVVGTFYATNFNQYYFSPFSIKTLPTGLKNDPITAYKFLPNLSAGDEIAGSTLENYSILQTEGVNLGFAPTVSANAVVNVQLPLPESPTPTLAFTAGTYNIRTGNNFIVGSSGIKYDGINVQCSNRYVNKYPGYNSDSYVSIVGIANIVTGLGDDRYGRPESAFEYISTGTSYTFSPSEITNIQNKVSTPINLTVWGGDCFIGPQTFKIADSAYSITDNISWNGPSQGTAVLKSKWNGVVYHTFNGTAISFPVAVKNAAQFLEVIIESEYNGEVRDLDILSKLLTSVRPVLGISSSSSARAPLTYKYNINLSKQNDEKVYFPNPQFVTPQNNFTARILYSDPKIYNTAEQGFDVVRALNFFDLQEKQGALTKLAIAGDALYGVQQRGTVYLPTNQNQLQQTDAGTLAVGTSDVIGRPIIVDSERGGQHLRGIVETGGLVYIPDNFNKAVYILQGQTLKNIAAETENNTEFRTLFASIIPEKNIIGIYDPIRLEYWMVINQGGNYTCQVFNEKVGYVSDFGFDANALLQGGVFADQNIYLIGTGTEDTGKLAVHKMYTGPNNFLMGKAVIPSVSFSINPDEDISKVFDNMMLSASDRLLEADLVCPHESELGDQTTTVDLDLQSIEGNFRVKVLLDQNISRMRGTKMLATIKWGELISNLSSLYTKYRLSPRTPF